MMLHDALGLLGFILACFLTACSGAFFRPGQWYDDLAKPSWQPPKWLFAPAWSILFITIAIAGWMVWRKAGFAGATLALTFYALQLVVNAIWSGLFFGMRRMDLAFVDVVLLWLLIVATIVAFRDVDPDAAWLMLPYLCWVSFASVLNFTVWRLNPAGVGPVAASGSR